MTLSHNEPQSMAQPLLPPSRTAREALWGAAVAAAAVAAFVATAVLWRPAPAPSGLAVLPTRTVTSAMVGPSHVQRSGHRGPVPRPGPVAAAVGHVELSAEEKVSGPGYAPPPPPPPSLGPGVPLVTVAA